MLPKKQTKKNKQMNCGPSNGAEVKSEVHNDDHIAWIYLTMRILCTVFGILSNTHGQPAIKMTRPPKRPRVAPRENVTVDLRTLYYSIIITLVLKHL